MPDAIHRLCEEYRAFMVAHNLTLGSADEHTDDENLTDEQRAYLRAFIARWDSAQDDVSDQGYWIEDRDGVTVIIHVDAEGIETDYRTCADRAEADSLIELNGED